MRVAAPAKINLWLSVGARRPDGYHEIVSVMQAVSLEDEVSLATTDAITVGVEPPGAAPEGDANLAARAARALAGATGIGAGAVIGLRKRIPAAAGLAGGSADAAATLVGLNDLWNAGLSRKALERIGASLGADVPFCVRGGTALARGTGTDLAPLASASLWWVLASTGEAVSTADVYAARDALGAGDVEDPADLADALARGDLDGVAAHLRNDLAAAAERVAPGIASGGEALRDAGALGVVLSGSGPTWCGLARDEAHAEQVAAVVCGALPWVAVASSLGRGPRIVER